MLPAGLVRETRRELGLSQRQLAFRAGTTQAEVSRVERGEVSPTITTLRELMRAMGRELIVASEPLAEWDPVHMRSTRDRAPEERLRLAIGWNRLAARLAAAGEKARADA